MFSIRKFSVLRNGTSILHIFKYFVDIKPFSIDEILRTLKNLSSDMKKGFDNLRHDVSILKTDVAGIKTDVAGLKTDVSILKTDVSNLQTRFGQLDRRLGNLNEQGLRNFCRETMGAQYSKPYIIRSLFTAIQWILKISQSQSRDFREISELTESISKKLLAPENIIKLVSQVF
jgi:predicted nuclease with TOPRIM domain